MPHGAPDASQVIKAGVVYPVFDLGELAVRLWSPVTFDRRGDVVGMDTFKNGLGFGRALATAAGVTYSLDTTIWLADGQSLKVSFDGTTSYYGGCEWYLPSCVPGLVGMEMAFAQDANIDRILLEMHYNVSQESKQARILFDRSDKKLYYMDWEGSSREFGSGLDVWDSNYFVNVWKLVIDIEHFQYVRFQANENVYDLSGIALLSATSVAPDFLYGTVQVSNDVLAACDFWVDRVIFTQNEPA